MSDLQKLTGLVREFCEARDWDQFHGAKDLAIGISTEAAELLDLFRFKNENEVAARFQDPTSREKIEDEIADIFFFVLRFSQMNKIDLEQSLRNKMAKSALKYPVESAKGSNKKYTET